MWFIIFDFLEKKGRVCEISWTKYPCIDKIPILSPLSILYDGFWFIYYYIEIKFRERGMLRIYPFSFQRYLFSIRLGTKKLINIFINKWLQKKEKKEVWNNHQYSSYIFLIFPKWEGRNYIPPPHTHTHIHTQTMLHPPFFNTRSDSIRKFFQC